MLDTSDAAGVNEAEIVKAVYLPLLGRLKLSPKGLALKLIQQIFPGTAALCARPSSP